MDEEDVLFQDFLYKLKQSKSGRFSRLVQERWKLKYFVLTCHGNQLVLKYYNKKPKQLHGSNPKAQISLCPSFKVEKLSNCHNRAFAVELTAPSHQLCLSANEQNIIDIFVFLLQTQIRLRDTVTDNLTEVKTEPSEAFARIGAKGANCHLHVSPWGLTLILKQSRVVLAQWPLKCVRYYESSGQGVFIIKAGMVAPMGEGIYHFHTLPGLDNCLYDTVDHYVINTLDRVKPNQRGTPEEIQDYIREFDCLHSLTVLTPTPLASNPEASKALKENWTASFSGTIESSDSQTSLASGSNPSGTSPRPAASETAAVHSVSSSVSSQGSPLVSNNVNRPLPSPQSPRPLPSPQSSRYTPSSQSPRSDQQRQSPLVQRQRDSPRSRGSPAPREDGRVSGRPPPPPPRNPLHGVARSARNSPRSARQDSLDGATALPPTVEEEGRRHSNPANVAFSVTHDMDIHPAIRKQLSYDSGATAMMDSNLSNVRQLSPISPGSLPPSSPGGSAGRSSCPVSSVSPRTSGNEPPADGDQKLETTVEDWLVSASCEDLSDHMRAVIFQQRQSQRLAAAAESTPPPAPDKEPRNNNDPDFIPPPFQNILSFRSGVGASRDRSQSFDVNSRMHKHGQGQNGTSGSSASPSIKQIRKMVSARSATKENLRKSLSNPNYLNLGSKEKLHQHRTQLTKSSHNVHEEAAKLSKQNKQKSRSLANLLPSSIRRYISRESISHPSSTTPSPDMRQTRHDTTLAEAEASNFRRQYSAQSLREMSVKGIHFTERSRSFRKPKGTQRSQSAEANHRNRLELEEDRSHSDNSLCRMEVDACQQTELPPKMEKDVLNAGDTSHYINYSVFVGKESENQERSSKSDYICVGAGGRNQDMDSKSDYITVGKDGAREETNSKSDSDYVENPVGNGVRLPSQSEWKIRLPSRTTSQTSC